MSRISFILAASLAVVALPAAAQDNAARNNGIATTTNIWAGVYTDAQAAQGQKFYGAACEDCHGEHQEGDPGQGFPGVAGPGFMVEWDGQTMADLVRHIHTRPNDNRSDMDPETAVEMAAFILKANGVPSGKTPLSTDAKEEAKILFTETRPK
jgi:mono/diheme cytochrome c family protein